MKRSLSLRAERLTDLAAVDLVSVVAAAALTYECTLAPRCLISRHCYTASCETIDAC